MTPDTFILLTVSSIQLLVDRITSMYQVQAAVQYWIRFGQMYQVQQLISKLRSRILRKVVQWAIRLLYQRSTVLSGIPPAILLSVVLSAVSRLHPQSLALWVASLAPRLLMEQSAIPRLSLLSLVQSVRVLLTMKLLI